MIDEMDVNEWVDFDIAMSAIAQKLGLLPGGLGKYKYIYWSNNRFGNMLGEMLTFMVEVGAVLHDEKLDKYKWNPDYDPDKFNEAYKERH